MINNELELLEFLNKLYLENQFSKLLTTLNENEKFIEKKYYEITRLKILSLIRLNKLIEASVIIKEEFNVAYIPREFEKFLYECRQEIIFLLRDQTRKNLTFEELENIDQLDNDSLVNILPKLKEFNLSSLTNKFQNIFDNPNISNLIKSLLIACLSDYKLDHKFVIKKEDNIIKFNPINVFDIRTGDNYLYIKNQLHHFKDIEINYLDLINRLIMSYLLEVYPLVISENSCNELLVASIFLVNQMMNASIKTDDFISIYDINLENVNKICQKINILLETI